MSYAYRPGLDGLRAIAVLAVMSYHARYDWAGGGFLGVDVFFVLSGFLITAILLGERQGEGRVDLGRFWSRRFRRLVPALLLVLFAVAAYAQWLANPIQLERIRDDGIASLLFVNNWHYVATGATYFDQFGIFSSPLRHTWSLGIEMQFYLVWPLVLVAVPRRWLLSVAATGILASAIAMAVLFQPHADPSRVYFGTDTHAQSILVGAALALVPLRRSFDRVAPISAAVLLAMIVFASDTSAWLYRGGFLVAALATATIVGAAQQRHGLTAAVLSWRPLVVTGRWSYGIYLWHWPVYLALDETSVRGPLLEVLRFAVTFALTAASFALVERPAQRMRLPLRPRLALPVLTACLVAATLVASTAGAPALTSRTVAVADRVPMPAPGGESVAPTEEGAGVFLVGDSSLFTLMFFGGWPERAGGTVASWAPIGCPVLRTSRVFDRDLPEECDQWPSEIRNQGETNDLDLVVLQFGIWDLAERVVDGQTLDPASPAFVPYFDGELDLARRLAGEHGAHLALLDVPCSKDFSDDEVATLNAHIDRYAAARTDVGVVHWGEFLCSRPELRPDRVHFDDETAPVVADWLAPRVFAEARQGRNARTTTPAS